MLDARELTEARSDANLLLPSSARVVTRPIASDGGGGQITGAPAYGATVAARIVVIGGGESGTGGGRVTRGDRVSDRTTHILTLPAGTAIEESNEIEVDGALYEVTAVRKRTGEEFVRRVEVREAG